MENLFLLLCLGCLLLFAIGIVKPSIVVRWGDETKKNRKSVLKTYGIGIIVFFVAFGVSSDATANNVPDKQEDQVQSAEVNSNAVEQNETQEQAVTEAEDPISVKEEATFKDGTHKVGVDIPAGDYLVISKNMGYIEVSSDSTGEFGSIIFNDNVLGHTYITIEDGEYLKLQNVVAYPISDAPSIIPADGLYKDGVYKVGQDIPAGEYKAILKDSMGYIEVTSDRRGGIGSIVSNEVPTGDTYITVSDGQYLKLQGVEIQK